MTPLTTPESAIKSQEISIIEILTEIQSTPKEYWPNLLQMLRLFRESVTLGKTKKPQTSEKLDDVAILEKQRQALTVLTQEWLEYGDEKEQKETLEYLQKIFIDEN